jgi:diphthamide synthase (EF-2-diphthine--ammonia ligase)
MCETVGLEALHPIYGLDTQAVMAEFLGAGFEAVIVSGRPDIFSGEQMGMSLGPEFLQWAAKQPDLDVCGEYGEYHTVVVDGPLFKKRIEITDSEPVQVNGHWFLDVRKWALREKG